MILKNLLRILSDYKFSLVTIVFFELLYLIKGYKGNRFDFSNNDFMSDNIPCPYYFLSKIKKILEKRNFVKFIDLGCGSGRVIDFFNKSFIDRNIIGVEYFTEQYVYCKKIFQNQENIKIIQADFTKSDFFQYEADCYFFNNPFKINSESIEFIERTINFLLKKKNILFIFVNYNKKILDELKNIQCIESFYISNIKGYSIYCLNDK